VSRQHVQAQQSERSQIACAQQANVAPTLLDALILARRVCDSFGDFLRQRRGGQKRRECREAADEAIVP
jgi:hypothetical protein